MKKIIFNFYQLLKFYFFFKKICQSKNEIKTKKGSDIILIEYFKYKASFIPYYYFANNLKKKNSKFLLYLPKIPTQKQKFRIFLDKIFPLSFYKFFNLFGVKNIVIPYKKKNQLPEKILNKLKTKKDVLNIKLENILVGDLIYDEFLRNEDKVTVDINSKVFRDHIKNSIYLFLFWSDFIKKNNINSIIYSHATYLIGLLPRLAVHKNIPAYKIGPANIYRTTKKQMYTHDDRKNYKKVYKLFPNKLKNKYLTYAKKNILNQFLGFQPDEKFIQKIIKIKKRKVKILIASHCFNDAVHIFGNFMFNDFHEWINYLANFSKKTNYEWYIKIHPGIYDRNIEKMLQYEKKFSNVKILPKSIFNKDILKLGLSAVLTVYGTVGREYPIFNIPVINASSENPHSEYKFNFHINNIKDYEKILKNISKIKINPIRCRKQIYEFYSAKYSNYNIIDEFRSSILNMKYSKDGNKFKQKIEDNVWNKWIENFSDARHNQINRDLNKFIKNKKIRMVADNTLGYSRYLDI